MKIYIDISNLMAVNFLTGIQRVVREVVVRLLEYTELQLVLLEYKPGTQKFGVFDNEEIFDFLKQKHVAERTVYTGDLLDINMFEPGAVFFDIDSVWNSTCSRSALFPQLKNQGLKIVTYIYDTIPINSPQYCHNRTILKFMDYFGANLQYSDAVIVSTQSVLDSIYEIADQLGIRRMPGYVSWLGADFASEDRTGEIRDDVQALVASGRKYILTVGTIEPRKNHQVLLDAFDNNLFDKDLDLVFVGRIGWNVDELSKRMKEHPRSNERFFHLVGLDDYNVDFLYRNAFMIAFPTFDEGFGLPMIEAFERGTPVIASDCKVLREVGKENAVYFPPESAEIFAEKIIRLVEQPQEYGELKHRVSQFIPFTWDQTTENIVAALRSFDVDGVYVVDQVKQMVVLSARCQDICSSLPFVEHYMPFIKELVLCCPDQMKEEFQQAYSGRLVVTILTDSELLAGNALPEDHQTRNFFLRSLVMRREEIDSVFIMSDDDYRPLETISTEVFVKDGQYQAYYCYSLKHWKGTAGNMTSYDVGMFRTLAFLEEQQYPVLQYSSHMPQIIDKGRYQEFLDTHKGIELLGLDEWSSYFNWLQYRYPNLIHVCPYVTMAWPGGLTDWRMMVYPDQYLFENYYEGLYEKNKVFSGMSKSLSDNTELENIQKKRLFMKQQIHFQKFQQVYSRYTEVYRIKHNEIPSFVLVEDKGIEIYTPQYVIFPKGGFVRVPAMLCTGSNLVAGSEIRISYHFHKGPSKLLEICDILKFKAEDTEFEIPIWARVNCNGEMNFTITVDYADKRYTKCMKAFLVDPQGFLNATEVI